MASILIVTVLLVILFALAWHDQPAKETRAPRKQEYPPKTNKAGFLTRPSSTHSTTRTQL
jgi:hypothetical protein